MQNVSALTGRARGGERGPFCNAYNTHIEAAHYLFAASNTIYMKHI